MNNNVILPDVPTTAPVSPETGTVEEVKKELDPVEQSGVFVNQAHKEFRRLMYSIAMKKAPGRVLEAVLFEPLEKVELLSKQEKQLFDLCQQIMYHKGVLMRYAFDKFEEKKEEGEKNESKEE